MAEKLDDIMEVGDDIEASSKISGYKASHKDVVGYWNTQIKAAEEKGKENREDAAEAEKFYRGDPVAWEDDATWTGPTTQENLFYRDVMVMSGQLLYTDPKTIASTNRSKDFKGFAKATQNFNNYVIKEQSYKVEIKRSLIQAIFRNYAVVHHTWDPSRQLPKIQWCANEVYPDINCQGDIKRADWVIEEFFPSLDELLEDPEIEPEVKKKLARHPTAYRYPEVGSSVDPGEAGDSEDGPAVDTKADPSRIQLRAFKVWTRKGIAPNLRAKALMKAARGVEEGDEEGDTEDDDKSSEDTGSSVDGNEKLEGGIPDDPNPEDQEQYTDALEEQRSKRRCLVIVENFPLVLKVTEWPLNFYDNDEFPFSILGLTMLPGDIYGVSLFKVLRPLLKVINFILSFWFTDIRESVRRDLFVDEDAFAEKEGENAVGKLGSGVHNQVLLTKKGRNKDAVHRQEYTATQDGPVTRLLEITRRGHDDTSGVNDMARGSVGQVEKTKSEALLLNDRAQESIGIIVDAIDDFIRDIARKTTMCLHTFVEAKSTFKKCKACKGKGAVADTSIAGQSLSGSDEVPCAKCGGSGNSSVVVHKGADAFLAEEDAKNWIDDLTLDQIRAEIVIDVEPGSTRRTNQERRQYQVLQLFTTTGPVLEKHGCWRAYGEMLRRIIMGTEVPDAESMAPTPEEWDEAVKVAEQLRQMAAQPPPPPPPPPDPTVVANIKAKADIEKARMDAAVNLRVAQMNNEIKKMELALKERELEIRDREVTTTESLGLADRSLKEKEVDFRGKEVEARGAIEEKRLAMDGNKLAAESSGDSEVRTALSGIVAKLDEIEDRISNGDLDDPMVSAANDAVESSREIEGYDGFDDVDGNDEGNMQKSTNSVDMEGLRSAIESNERVCLSLISEIRALGKIMATPARLVRDAKGRATHAVRDVASDTSGAVPAPMRSKEK